MLRGYGLRPGVPDPGRKGEDAIRGSTAADGLEHRVLRAGTATALVPIGMSACRCSRHLRRLVSYAAECQRCGRRRQRRCRFEDSKDSRWPARGPPSRSGRRPLRGLASDLPAPRQRPAPARCRAPHDVAAAAFFSYSGAVADGVRTRYSPQGPSLQDLRGLLEYVNSDCVGKGRGWRHRQGHGDRRFLGVDRRSATDDRPASVRAPTSISAADTTRVSDRRPYHALTVDIAPSR